MVVQHTSLDIGSVDTANVSGITTETPSMVHFVLVGCHNGQVDSLMMNNPPHCGRQDLPSEEAGFVLYKLII